jgi:hypothetical protein
MLGGFTNMQYHDAESAAAMTAGYLWTVRDRPPWAILRACEMVRAGTAGLNRSYCPHEPEFNSLIGRIVAVYELRLRAVESLLSAKVEPTLPRSAEDKARVAATAEDFKKRPGARETRRQGKSDDELKNEAEFTLRRYLAEANAGSASPPASDGDVGA